jgi:hypothetical protein
MIFRRPGIGSEAESGNHSDPCKFHEFLPNEEWDIRSEGSCQKISRENDNDTSGTSFLRDYKGTLIEDL